MVQPIQGTSRNRSFSYAPAVEQLSEGDRRTKGVWVARDIEHCFDNDGRLEAKTQCRRPSTAIAEV